MPCREHYKSADSDERAIAESFAEEKEAKQCRERGSKWMGARVRGSRIKDQRDKDQRDRTGNGGKPAKLIQDPNWDRCVKPNHRNRSNITETRD